MTWPISLFAAPQLQGNSVEGKKQKPSPIVRVRMSVAKKQVTISGRFKVAEGRYSRFTTILIRKEGRQFVTQILGAKSERNKPSLRSSLIFEGQDLAYENLKLPNKVLLAPNQLPGTFDIVGLVDLETYLAGVLPSEMPKSWPLEAIKAQAVASRSYVFRKMRERNRLHFDVENSIFDQVFQWNSANGDPKITQVLKETNAQVLITPSKKLIKTFYHSQCGGITESSKAVWGLVGLKSVKDSYCLQDSKPWEHQVPKDKLSEMIRLALNLNGPGELMKLGIGNRTSSGRVDRFIAQFSNNEKHFIRGDQMRSILGYGKLKSTQVEVVSNDDDWLFRGKGFGHGVGMCQWGAKSMAAKNHDYQEILNHYYPGSAISKLR